MITAHFFGLSDVHPMFFEAFQTLLLSRNLDECTTIRGFDFFRFCKQLLHGSRERLLTKKGADRGDVAATACHCLSLPVSRKAFVDVMMSKCGVCRDPPVLSVMPPYCTTTKIVIIDLLKWKPKISWYSYPTTGSLYLA
jgi:hypothetical protein